MQSSGLDFIKSQSQLAIWAGLSLTQTRTREVVLGLFGPGTWRVCHSSWPLDASCARTAVARVAAASAATANIVRSEEHTSELQSLMRISYAVFCLKKKK